MQSVNWSETDCGVGLKCNCEGVFKGVRGPREFFSLLVSLNRSKNTPLDSLLTAAKITWRFPALGEVRKYPCLKLVVAASSTNMPLHKASSVRGLVETRAPTTAPETLQAVTGCVDTVIIPQWSYSRSCLISCTSAHICFHPKKEMGTFSSLLFGWYTIGTGAVPSIQTYFVRFRLL